MSICESTFKYGGIDFAPYGLQILYVETDPDGRKVEANAKYETTRVKSSRRFYITKREHRDPYEFEMEIVSENPLDTDGKRRLIPLLFDTPNYQKLEIVEYRNPEYVDVYYNCILTEEEELSYGDGCHGWKCTVLCDAPYGWEPVKKQAYDLAEGSSFVFTNTSDETAPMWAKIELTMKNPISSDTVNLQNVTDGRVFSFRGASGGEVIQIDEYGQIHSNAGKSYYDSMSGSPIRFLHGDNNISVSNNIAQIKITYQNARRVGS